MAEEGQVLRDRISACLAELHGLAAATTTEAPPEVQRFVRAAILRASGELLDAVAMLRPPDEVLLAIGRAERDGDWAEVERLLRITSDRAKARQRRAVLG